MISVPFQIKMAAKTRENISCYAFRHLLSVSYIKVRFVNFIPMRFFQKSLHTPYGIPSSAARYLMSKIRIITAGLHTPSLF